ncbi:uncharacterized protein METZ01_LOCUS305582 [marine metagenome]|uniref:Uncharacterized protein n=1 Tax=marine metagenome TaxID=408172 RepID=A0A382MWK3_9ZZZZ
MKTKLFQILMCGVAAFFISCDTSNNTALEEKLNEIGDNQKVLLKKIENMDKSIANLTLAVKSKPADNKKQQQPPQADPNKVYNIEIGDSYIHGAKDAKVTIIEWMDFQ